MFVVIGTVTTDLFVTGMPRFANLDDGFQARNLVFCRQPLLMLLGGNGGNSAYVLARLGVETAVCSSIGNDEPGDWLANKLAAQGVNTAGLLRPADLATSSSTILLFDNEQQAVFHHKGATDGMAITAVHEPLLSQAEVLLVSSYPLFPKMRAGGFMRAFRLAHAGDALAALDIGPAIDQPVTTAEIAPLFPYLDFLIANTHELVAGTGMADWETAVSHLLAHGCPAIVIKKGVQGTAVRSQQLNVEVPAFSVPTHISVGAGDAFNAGFLYTLWTDSKRQGAANTNRPIHSEALIYKALRYGSAVAALVASAEKGVLDAPTGADVDSFLQARPHTHQSQEGGVTID